MNLQEAHRHDSNIARHYIHAVEKHPYFCDQLIPGKEYVGNIAENIRVNLAEIRRRVDFSTEKRRLAWDELLAEEVWEVLEAIHNGDNAAAVEELYDCIAILLRVVDVLEGRQKLGTPKTISGNPAGK